MVSYTLAVIRHMAIDHWLQFSGKELVAVDGHQGVFRRFWLFFRLILTDTRSCHVSYE
jgi:hypothetical protein